MAGTKTEEDAKMAKLYFKYGAMGSSKSAQALITKFNYEELGMTVWLIKPSVDTRDGADIIKSRIGLAKKADIILPEDNIIEKFDQHPGMDVIIADECQFFTPEQIDQLRTLVDERDMPVICFGLRTDFLTHLFPGGRRLFEVADSLTEIKTVCACGHKATVNARIAGGGKAAVFLMNDMDSTVFPGVFLADVAAAVRAAIVHQHKVKIRKRLGKDAVHAPVQERLHLVDWDNYADRSHRLLPFVSFSASEKALSACDRSSLPAVL